MIYTPIRYGSHSYGEHILWLNSFLLLTNILNILIWKLLQIYKSVEKHTHTGRIKRKDVVFIHEIHAYHHIHAFLVNHIFKKYPVFWVYWSILPLQVESEEKYERIGGTSMGGGTFWGLGSILTKAKVSLSISSKSKGFLLTFSYV